MADGRAAPWRTCVGCRDRAAKQDLLRVVVVEGVLVPDPQGRMPGRGAYVHPALACLDLAERRRAFPRALRTPGPLGLGMLQAYLEGSGVSVTDQRGVGDEGGSMSR